MFNSHSNSHNDRESDNVVLKPKPLWNAVLPLWIRLRSSEAEVAVWYCGPTISYEPVCCCGMLWSHYQLWALMLLWNAVVPLSAMSLSVAVECCGPTISYEPWCCCGMLWFHYQLWEWLLLWNAVVPLSAMREAVAVECCGPTISYEPWCCCGMLWSHYQLWTRLLLWNAVVPLSAMSLAIAVECCGPTISLIGLWLRLLPQEQKIWSSIPTHTLGIFFLGLVIPVTYKNWHSSGYPARSLAL